MMFPFFTILKRAGLFRVSEEVEDAGLDDSKHGGLSRPARKSRRTVAAAPTRMVCSVFRGRAIVMIRD